MAVFTGSGSAASPSITFSADTNTGIFSPGADQVAISTNGTNRLHITSAGLVGIGTSSPGVPLDINGATAQTYLRVGPSTGDPLTTTTIIAEIRGDTATNGAGPGLRFWSGVTTTELYSTRESGGAASTFSIDTRSGGAVATALFIDSSRKVGIGTTSPGHLLDVAGTINSTAMSGFNTQNDSTTLIPLAVKDLGAGTDEKTWRVAQTQRSSKSLQIGLALNDASSIANASISIVRNGVAIDNIQFATGSNSERARIDSSGRLLVGTSTGLTSSSVGGAEIEAGGAAFFAKAGGSGPLRLSRSTSNGSQITFFNQGATAGSITTNSTSTTQYNTSSDYRLKINIAPMSDGIDRLLQLKPSRFNFIPDPDTAVDGFVAHEVQDIVPEAITGEKDAVDDEGNPVYQGIDQSKLVPLLTAALQEAVAKIEVLEQRLTAAGID